MAVHRTEFPADRGLRTAHGSDLRQARAPPRPLTRLLGGTQAVAQQAAPGKKRMAATAQACAASLSGPASARSSTDHSAAGATVRFLRRGRALGTRLGAQGPRSRGEDPGGGARATARRPPECGRRARGARSLQCGVPGTRAYLGPIPEAQGPRPPAASGPSSPGSSRVGQELAARGEDAGDFQPRVCALDPPLPSSPFQPRQHPHRALATLPLPGTFPQRSRLPRDPEGSWGGTEGWETRRQARLERALALSALTVPRAEPGLTDSSNGDYRICRLWSPGQNIVLLNYRGSTGGLGFQVPAGCSVGRSSERRLPQTVETAARLIPALTEGRGWRFSDRVSAWLEKISGCSLVCKPSVQSQFRPKPNQTKIKNKNRGQGCGSVVPESARPAQGPESDLGTQNRNRHRNQVGTTESTRCWCHRDVPWSGPGVGWGGE
ncbi:uncharacterized protein LOC106010366 [Heterocephalus glaber]|uniref:Uncharacterized protein LOC106010366 n=1 Tax=Heterocephalus glaber TaxID=10181 RepID=A0AAX6R8M0_HETGA|nr:uncharacterized protein LOC106010366 [Heterocephalus glaber]